MNRSDIFSNWNESRVHSNRGQAKAQMSGILESITSRSLVYWNPSLHEALGPVYTTHRIYIGLDYVEFTQDKIYSDWCRLQYNSFHLLSTAPKLKFIWIAQSTREELEIVLKFIHICCEFSWVKTVSLKLIRIKILPGKTLSTLFSVLVFIQISSFWLLLLWITSKRNRLIQINFYPFPHLPGQISLVWTWSWTHFYCL